MIRNITGIGAGNGPLISIHDGFIGLNTWKGFLAGADRVALDTHPYICFLGGNGGYLDSMPVQIMKPCYLADMNATYSNFGFTGTGEFSAAVNDCGKWVRLLHSIIS